MIRTNALPASDRLSAPDRLPPPAANGDSRLREELSAFVAGRCGAEKIDAETDLLAEGLLDSLLVMDLIAHVESAYGVRLGNDDIAPRNFRTVAAVAGLVSARRS